MSLIAALALLVVASLSSSSAASHLVDLEPGGSFTAESLGKVVFDSNVSDVECDVTLHGAFDAGPVSNVANAKIGDVDNVEIDACEGIDDIIVLDLPWAMKLSTAVTASSASFYMESAAFELVNFVSLDCLYAANLLAAIEIISGLTGLITSLQNSISRAPGESIFCPSSGRLAGVLALDPQQAVIQP